MNKKEKKRNEKKRKGKKRKEKKRKEKKRKEKNRLGNVALSQEGKLTRIRKGRLDVEKQRGFCDCEEE